MSVATETRSFDLVGQVPVDSGQLMLIDPCYIDSEWNKREGLNYNAACNVTLSENGAGMFGASDGFPLLAFATETYIGDGVYNVYAQRDNHGRIQSIYIDLTEPNFALDDAGICGECGEELFAATSDVDGSVETICPTHGVQ